MVFSRRRLPHFYEEGRPVFLTWCLQGSLPSHRVFPAEALTSGQAFAALDRLLDEARGGVDYLRQPRIADLIVEGIRYNAEVLRHYSLHAYTVMPNHVHLLVTPVIPLPKLTKSLKGITAKRANAMLKLKGKTFWQDESYDRLVRNGLAFDRIRNYIEQNPVRAGLVSEASDYAWSSAGATGGSPLRTRASAPQVKVREPSTRNVSAPPGKLPPPRPAAAWARCPLPAAAHSPAPNIWAGAPPCGIPAHWWPSD